MICPNKYLTLQFQNEDKWYKYDNNQEMLGWGAYLPLPGFDKKGRMVLFCQMEVLIAQHCSTDNFSKNIFYPILADNQPSKDQLQSFDVVLPDGHIHCSQGDFTITLAI